MAETPDLMVNETPEQPAAPEQQVEQPETPVEGKREVTDYEKELREESRQHRLEAKGLRTELDTLKSGLAAALGIQSNEPADMQATVESVTRERDDLNSKVATAERELFVLRAAHRLNVDGDALLDSRRFGDALAALDPTAPDYADQVQALIKESAPKPPLPAKSGPEAHGDPQDKYSVDYFRRSHT